MNPTDHLDQLFGSFTRSAWRWECQGEYAVDAAKLQRWRDGLAPDLEAKRPWLDYIRSITEAGKMWQRVRMLTDPLTEYLRWLLEQTQTNVDAGEDIRWVDGNRARELGMPDYDFYLFDEKRVAIMRFDDDRLLCHVEVIDSTKIVEQHQRFRDIAWPHAIRHVDYYTTRSP